MAKTVKKPAAKPAKKTAVKAKPAEVKKKAVKPAKPVKAAKPASKPAAKTVKAAKPAVKDTKKAKPAAVKAKPVVKAKANTKEDVKKVKVTKTKKTEPMPKKKAVKEVEKAPVKLEAAPKSKPVKGYGKEDLEHFKKIILEKRDEIIEQLQNLQDQMVDSTTGEYINENSPYSLHMAEQGTDAMEREKTFLYAQRENKFLGYLEDALKRIESGTYGICVECIDTPQHLCPTCPLIPKARLEAVPHSQLCVEIKKKQERK